MLREWCIFVIRTFIKEKLFSLTTLNISNNWLQTLPGELSDCSLLSSVDLSFNYFKQVCREFLVILSFLNFLNYITRRIQFGHPIFTGAAQGFCSFRFLNFLQ